jgi:hypothetical protein
MHTTYKYDKDAETLPAFYAHSDKGPIKRDTQPEMEAVISERFRIPTLPSLTWADIQEAIDRRLQEEERERVRQVVAKFRNPKPPIKREEEE